jgi:hypothetical protein
MSCDVFSFELNHLSDTLERYDTYLKPTKRLIVLPNSTSDKIKLIEKLPVDHGD